MKERKHGGADSMDFNVDLDPDMLDEYADLDRWASPEGGNQRSQARRRLEMYLERRRLEESLADDVRPRRGKSRRTRRRTPSDLDS